MVPQKACNNDIEFLYNGRTLLGGGGKYINKPKRCSCEVTKNVRLNAACSFLLCLLLPLTWRKGHSPGIFSIWKLRKLAPWKFDCRITLFDHFLLFYNSDLYTFLHAQRVTFTMGVKFVD